MTEKPDQEHRYRVRTEDGVRYLNEAEKDQMMRVVMATSQAEPLDSSPPVTGSTLSPTKSVFLSNLHHAYAQTDGTYAFPNSREGDMLKTAKREIEQLLKNADRANQLMCDWWKPQTTSQEVHRQYAIDVTRGLLPNDKGETADPQ